MERSKASSVALWLIGAAVVLGLIVAVARPWAGAGEQDTSKVMQSEHAANMVTISVPIEGMSCSACAASVKQATTAIEGVTEAKIDLAERRARIRYVDGAASPDQIAKAIDDLGFKTGTPVVEEK